MSRRVLAAGCAAVLVPVLLIAATAKGSQRESSLSDVVQRAISGDEQQSRQAVQTLRAAGPAGLDALLAHVAPEVNGAAQREPIEGPRWRRVCAVIDRVAGQRDAHVSRLYWHTDLEQAKVSASASGRPILSLRLLGRLDEEYSCANSRFFRTVLYANEAVSAALRERFVLHWQSVRPVPVVTIDMGDGRVLRRTITGNSIHYLLDADGRPLDAFPGLYGPKAFLRVLGNGEALERNLRGLDEGERSAALATWHRERVQEIARGWAMDLERIGAPIEPSSAGVLRERPQRRDASPTAAEAAPLAIGKSAVETPLVRALSADPVVLQSTTDEAMWERIAELHAADARLDGTSRQLVRAKLPPSAQQAGPLAKTKAVVESPLVRILRNLERSIALDSVRNEYLFHRQVHQWFAEALPDVTDLDRLNEKVYAELFLTPSSDPWLGLVPPDTYSALEGNGLVGTATGARSGPAAGTGSGAVPKVEQALTAR